MLFNKRNLQEWNIKLLILLVDTRDAKNVYISTFNTSIHVLNII